MTSAIFSLFPELHIQYGLNSQASLEVGLEMIDERAV